MVIDLTKVGSGMEMSRYEEMKLKSSCLLREMSRNVMENYNYIIVPIAIYNMIENHDMFQGEYSKDDEQLYFVGNWYHFKVYVDMLMPSNQILMRYDKQTTRDIKIDKILNNIEANEELTVEVKDFSLENPY